MDRPDTDAASRRAVENQGFLSFASPRVVVCGRADDVVREGRTRTARELLELNIARDEPWSVVCQVKQREEMDHLAGQR